MNSFSHALPFLSRGKYYPIGCALPDWLGAVDRRCRVRKNGAAKLIDQSGSFESELALGITQHIDDDRWFHMSEKFSEMSMQFAVELRETLTDEPGFRPGFLGHIIIELLLDGYLHEKNPGKMDLFYSFVADSDPEEIQDAVNRMATRPTDKLAKYFPVFLREKYLYDYGDDSRLMYRVNFVLKRVKLKPVGDDVLNWVPSARQRVYDSARDLLIDYPAEFLG
jgi:hypothetical protein